MNYQSALDEIFRSFMDQTLKVQGSHDREARQPEHVFGLAKRLGFYPSPDQLLRVTGSKGKGTAARMSAAIKDVKALVQSLGGEVGELYSR